MKTFSERLREVIAESGMTQLAFAKFAGVKAPTLSNYLTGAREPAADAVFKLATAGNISPQWLLTGEGPRQSFTAKLAEAARTASEMKDQVDPGQVIFDLLIERQRTERLEAELAEVREQLHKLKEAVLQGAPMLEQMLKVAKSH